MMTAKDFAAKVDHTLLKMDATEVQIRQACALAQQFETASVCVNSYWVATVKAILKGSPVATCSVVGFPLGAVHISAAMQEAQTAIADGAIELDMVMPLGLIKSGAYKKAELYVSAVRDVSPNVLLKVILETASLTPEEIVKSCQIAVSAGANYVKTSTGFSPVGGASVEAVSLMRQTVGSDIGVKASGGIKTLVDATRLIEAGASRVGMSATAAIMSEIEAPD